MLAVHDHQLLANSLTVGALLVSIGAVGLASRRGAAFALLSVTIVLQGVLLSLASLGFFHGNSSGQTVGLFGLVVVIFVCALALTMRSRTSRLKASNTDVVQGISEPEERHG